jgi:hypothetical protein
MPKRFLRLAAAVAGLMMVAVPAAAADGTGPIGTGLWSASTPGSTGPDVCAQFTLDPKGFCVATNSGEPSVELGVNFTSSKAVNIVGVRIYRADGGPVTGALWGSDGTRLAGPASFSGTFANDGSLSNDGWQDVQFSTPVAITPGQTYVASYNAPTPIYAFQHDFFTNNSYTVGPITALASTASGGNGVFNYCSPDCFPSKTFDDSNYWVTPVWSYGFAGFYQPVDNEPTWNSVKAGSSVPVKFSLGGYTGLDILNSGAPTVTPVACPGNSATVDPIEQTTTANNGLTYDSSAGQYVYVWKTSKAFAGHCYQFSLGLNDGTTHTFEISFN